MPLNVLFLILVNVISAAAFTVWVATSLVSPVSVSPILGLTVLSALALAGSLLLRVASKRHETTENDQAKD
ncbi:hypothetical protein SAMN05444003_0819 [Cognatiyoonia sediminum]|uniref:Uncharacterized protein n=1 Tax=Cognatiyoonia sediminum TaxID=1508389 RepID=A0A1M5MG77_9RHOB|nr:hypothetical protein [Cognatiyoonia sediminum]SHG76378.1 hypothetical protein SAMN05444003_0819 [Cognatiyoonia sediminum]